MFNWFVKKINNRKGFTLVELIVVIAILAILGAIAVPKFTSTLAGSKAKADEATAKVLQSAALVYQANHTSNSLPAVADFKASGGMKDYLSADVLTATGVKAPQQGGSYKFYYNTSTGEVRCSNAAITDFTVLPD